MRNRLIALFGLGCCGLFAVSVMAGADRTPNFPLTDGPITIEGRVFASRADFISRGLRCGVQNPSQAVQLQIERSLNQFRANLAHTAESRREQAASPT